MVMQNSGINLPQGFYLGTASAAYQIEGATNIDGRGPSIWDQYVLIPGAIENGDTGDITCDHYNRWSEDVEIMKYIGLNAYRFSISWSRILPKGRGDINKKGLDFYSKLVDALLDSNITPFVTLNHFDLPQKLQEEQGGWLRRDIQFDFKEYTNIVTQELGDRVKHWTTFNEPWELAWQGYHKGEDAPGLTLGVNAALRVSHNVYLSHGQAIQVIRDNIPDAEAGIVIHLNNVEPATQRPQDKAAAKRWEGCQNRWYLDPIYYGEYPEDMMKLYGHLNPKISDDDMSSIQQPIDYLGLNMYRRSVVAEGPNLAPINITRISPPGEYSDMGWEVYPKGLYDVLKWTDKNYPIKKIYVTENGVAYDYSISADGRCHDLKRIKYLKEHICQALKARKEGIPLQGYFVWSTMDNFEWAYGYSKRFGIIHIDYNTQKRTIKDSGLFLKKVLNQLSK
jgi:beta-glucosidase